MAIFAKGSIIHFSLGNFLPLEDQLANDPDLQGPSLLCNVSGTVVGTFSGAGDPITDLYAWRIYAPSGDLLFSRAPGAFQTINYTFISNGIYRVELDVSRGGIVFEKFNQPVEVVHGPVIILSQDYISCSLQPLEIQAIDPSSSNFSSYKFEWKNDVGTIVSNSNTLLTSDEGNFSVKFFIENSSGEKTCEFQLTTVISSVSTILLQSSETDVCVDGEITFETVPELFGEWFVQKIGSPTPKSLGSGTSITIRPGSDLVDFGDYEVSFHLGNLSNPSCSPQGKSTFSYNPEPIFVYEAAETSSGCLQADGKLIIKALTDLDYINIEGTGLSYGPFVAGELIEIPNLKSGTYNLIGGLGSCINSIGSVVPLANPPAALEFTIDDIIGEACTENGKIPGSFQVTMLNGINPNALYRVINEKGGLALNQGLPNSAVFRVDLPGGRYFFEIYDENDECILPSRNELLIPGKDQTNFQIPETLNICQTFDLIPATAQNLVFTITRPDLTTDTKNAGEPILLNQKGEYKIIGTLPGQADVCPTEQMILVDLVDPVDFEVIQISEDCIVGNRSYEANIYSRDPSTVLFIWRDEKNEIIGTSQRLDLPPTSFGNYSLEVQPANSESCPIPPKQFLVKEPVLSVDVTMVATKLCEFGPKAIINLSTTFPDEVNFVEWRRYDASGNIEVLSQFDHQYQIEVDIEGTYEASVFSFLPEIGKVGPDGKGCELGRSTLILDLTTQKVDFSIPSELSICDPYSFTPLSTEPLTFILTYPNGSMETKGWNEAFEINTPGTYTILGYNTDVNFPLCPEQKTFSVIVNPPVQFSPRLENLTCDGEYEYLAEISNYDLTEVDIYWRNEAGTVVSTDPVFFTSNYGEFSLEVQPSGSIACSASLQPITIPTPVLSIPTEILAETLCPDQPDAALRVNANLEYVQTIQWWFTDLSNITSQMTVNTNKRDILATEEGTYEVRLINPFGCLIGSDNAMVIRSTDQVRPAVKESYQICPRYEIAEIINPGSFSSYEWHFESNLVSTSPTFKPLQIGQYQLTVTSAEGCSYQTSFLTEEECELKVAVPSAMFPGNPDKNFLVYTNYLVDDLEIWIFNKWGQIIFHCKNSNLITEESTCAWDGFYEGKKILPGTYAYRMNFKNNEKNISQYQLGSILVID